MTHKYRATVRGIMEWANAEMAHVGRIASIEDADIQYSYAISTVNGMLHLRQAIFELIKDDSYSEKLQDLQKTHNSVIKVIKHLIKEYDVDLETIKKFNTRGVLNGFNFLDKKRNNKTKKGSKIQ